MSCGKLPGANAAYGYWGRSPYKRVQQEESAERIRVLLQDKLVSRGVPVWLYLPVTSGVVCTCRKETNQANDRPCPECYGTGFVPGFLRFMHETVYFTASQIDSAGFAVLDQTITGPTWTPTTVVPHPALAGGTVVPLGLTAGPWSPSTTLFSPSVLLPSGLLTAPAWTSSAEVMGTAAVTTSGGALNNVMLDRKFKPNYLRLAEGALTGTLITGLIPYSNPNNEAWRYAVDSYVVEQGTSVTVEYSYDFGATFFPMVNIIEANPPVAGDGFLMFRVTLSRSSATQRSPAFSAVRARHVSSEFYRRALLSWRPDLLPGQVLVLRPWVVEQARNLPGQGVVLDWLGDRSWTMPLDFYDTRIVRDTPAARIPDRAPGPHPFYEHATGIKTGDRVTLTTMKWNEELGLFTHQSFDERRIQEDEPPYADVF